MQVFSVMLRSYTPAVNSRKDFSAGTYLALMSSKEFSSIPCCVLSGAIFPELVRFLSICSMKQKVYVYLSLFMKPNLSPFPTSFFLSDTLQQNKLRFNSNLQVQIWRMVTLQALLKQVKLIPFIVIYWLIIIEALFAIIKDAIIVDDSTYLLMKHIT